MKKRPGLRHSETGTLSRGFKRCVVSTTGATTRLSPALGCSNFTAFRSKVPSSGWQLHRWKTLPHVTSRIQRTNPFLPSVHTAPPAMSPPRGEVDLRWIRRLRRVTRHFREDFVIDLKSGKSDLTWIFGLKVDSHHPRSSLGLTACPRRYLPPSVAKDSLEKDLRQSQKGKHLDLG